MLLDFIRSEADLIPTATGQYIPNPQSFYQQFWYLSCVLLCKITTKTSYFPNSLLGYVFVLPSNPPQIANHGFGKVEAHGPRQHTLLHSPLRWGQQEAMSGDNMHAPQNITVQPIPNICMSYKWWLWSASPRSSRPHAMFFA